MRRSRQYYSGDFATWLRRPKNRRGDPPNLFTSGRCGIIPDRVDLTNRIDALTESETLTLRMYLHASDPKDIARELGKSPHTIDKYLKSARQKLGVRRSLDAAHLLAQHEGNPLYGEVVYRPSAGGVSWAQMLFGGPERPWVALPKWTRVGLVVGGLIAITVIAVLAIDIAETLSRLDRP